jgi:hypothetical protein
MTAGEFEISSLGKGWMVSPLKGIDFFKAGEMRNFNPVPTRPHVPTVPTSPIFRQGFRPSIDLDLSRVVE